MFIQPKEPKQLTGKKAPASALAFSNFRQSEYKKEMRAAASKDLEDESATIKNCDFIDTACSLAEVKHAAAGK